MYPIRSGTRERPSYVLNVNLKSGQQSNEYWIKENSFIVEFSRVKYFYKCIMLFKEEKNKNYIITFIRTSVFLLKIYIYEYNSRI